MKHVCHECRHFKVCFIARTLMELGVLSGLKISYCRWAEADEEEEEVDV